MSPVRPGSVWLRGAMYGTAAALAWASPAAALAHACTSPAVGLIAGTARSHWQEFDAHGNSLLRERGTLRTAGLRLAGYCENAEWLASWELSQGSRDYDGVTNTQTPLQTTTQLRMHRIALEGWLPVHGSWALGTQLAWRDTARDIAGVGAVRGYPERYRYGQVAAGARYRVALHEHWQLSATAWLGGGPRGHVRLQLPGLDAARLPLGSHRMAALSLELDGGAAAGESGWSTHAALALRHERTGAGARRLITRAGLPAATAQQPRIQQHFWSAQLQAIYRF